MCNCRVTQWVYVHHDQHYLVDNEKKTDRSTVW